MMKSKSGVEQKSMSFTIALLIWISCPPSFEPSDEETTETSSSLNLEFHNNGCYDGHQKNQRGYEHLLSRQSSVNSSKKKEVKAVVMVAVLKRSSTTRETVAQAKIHPLLKVLASKNMKKAAMKPEFLRWPMGVECR